MQLCLGGMLMSMKSEYLSTVILPAIIHTEFIKSYVIPSTTTHNIVTSHDATEQYFSGATNNDLSEVIFSYGQEQR